MTVVRGLAKLQATQLYRPQITEPAANLVSGKWGQPIDRLLASGYAFLAAGYSDDGYLYRGMTSGLSRLLAGNTLCHFSSNNELAQVESIMDVYFFSHELSDALAVARLSDGHPDAAVIAMPAATFNRALRRRTAATLAIGDGGLIFRYPFMTGTVVLDRECRVITASRDNDDQDPPGDPTGHPGRLVMPPADPGPFSQALQHRLQQAGVPPATPAPWHEVPTSADLRPDPNRSPAAGPGPTP